MEAEPKTLMYITSGSLKGKKLRTVKGFFTRPLLTRVRKSLFDILGDTIQGTRFLDLYAGSGAVGIEALSRGAKEVVFVEVNPKCVKIIKENLINCGVFSRAKIYQEDVLQILPFLLKQQDFSFIFVGPPYFKGLQDKTIDIIEKCRRCLAELIVQHSAKEKVNFERETIRVVEKRRYGDTCLTFLIKEKQQ